MGGIQKQWFAYEHLKPDGNGSFIQFYIGKGDVNRVKSVRRKENPHHTNIVSKYGEKNIKVVAYEFATEIEAFAKECELIQRYRNEQGIPLVNCTDGGEGSSGYKHTEENLQRIAQAAKSYHANLLPDQKEVLYRRIASALTGREMSQESKKKNRAAHLGCIHSEETKRKRANALRGQARSEETKSLMSEKAKLREERNSAARASGLDSIHFNKGRKHTETARENIAGAARLRAENMTFQERHAIGQRFAAINTGRKHSEESIRRMSESAKAWRAEITEDEKLLTSQKMSDSHKLRQGTRTEEEKDRSRKRMSESAKLREAKLTEEEKVERSRKLSEAQRVRYASMTPEEKASQAKKMQECRAKKLSEKELQQPKDLQHDRP